MLSPFVGEAECEAECLLDPPVDSFHGRGRLTLPEGRGSLPRFFSLAEGEKEESISGGCPQAPNQRGIAPSGLPRSLTSETGTPRNENILLSLSQNVLRGLCLEMLLGGEAASYASASPDHGSLVPVPSGFDGACHSEERSDE